ncbi:MAG TPA: hypothetical protein DCE52_01915 [Rhodobacteraceae bacterium]|jgi:transmembrane sensor|nr:hypothetical protein [Paracoccaceae bacterium]
MESSSKQDIHNPIESEAWTWVASLSGDTPPSPEDIQRLHRWMAQSPAHHQALRRISEAWDDMDVLTALAVPGNRGHAPAGVFSATLAWLLSPLILLWLVVQRSATFSLASPARFASVAMVLAIGLSAGLWQQAERQSAVYMTALGQQSSHQLPDGSSLTLNTNSKVSVAFLQDKRLITLHRGEAHFEVKPDKARPFEVYAGTRMVRAVGTAFSVHMKNQQVEVLVSEGKVALGVQATPPDAEQVAQLARSIKPKTSPPPATQTEVLGSLVAGQSVVIPAGPAGVMDNIAEHEKQSLKRRLAWLGGQLIYAGEGLDKVIADVGRYTPIYIEIIDPALADIRIGGQFKVGETEALFKVLEVGFALKVNRLSEFHVQISRAD